MGMAGGRVRQMAERIAVLGGGLGSLSTVFQMTNTPGWQDKYDITIYQMGWRAGGKCASGRDMRDGYGSRILEHGLHLFAGFYNYCFKMLSDCYAELDRPDGHPNQRVWDAFIGLDQVTLMDKSQDPDGTERFNAWAIDFSPLPGNPGDTVEPAAITDLMVALIKLMGAWDPAVRANMRRDEQRGITGAFQKFLNNLKWTLEDLAIDAGNLFMHKVITDLEKHNLDPDLNGIPFLNKLSVDRLMMLSFLVRSVVRGIIVDNVLTDGFDPLDKWEFSDWIYRHAVEVARFDKLDVRDPEVAAKALIESPVIHSGYDYVFGYADGVPGKRGQGAGTTLRGMLRFTLGYKGHLFYTMRGGMGDVVIAPLYELLVKRGVKFAFFQRVEKLVPGETGIDAIEMSTQAETTGKPYSPLIHVPLAGWSPDFPLPCWPCEPLWDQLENGEQLKASGIDFEAPWSPALSTRTLTRGADFDRIVLGIPIGELKRICADLPARNPKWGEMFDKVATTRTIATQLWSRRTLADLGTNEPGRALAGYAQPLSVWADMTHLLSREAWTAYERPQSITYLCGQFPGDALTSAEEAAELEAQTTVAVRDWFRADAASQWPRAACPESAYGVNPELLYDPQNRVGDARFDSQFWKVNATPSEMYVQSVPNSVGARLRANESGFDNLFLCGDWTKNGLNAGAAEAAVMSGVICARALAGEFGPIYGEMDISIGPMPAPLTPARPPPTQPEPTQPEPTQPALPASGEPVIS